ncbi:UBX domain-containing protein 7-like [Clytia hemisphaerica]|uniref:UBX domain-containing protein n=1 Tax=Clytia hemisphaerica TaxID=252671 RepID=A0A7M5V1V5_9CNID|eukprot:TCONS_00068222-protein
MAAASGKISSDLIQQYVNITGSDEESALHLLEAFNGDLESAVNMYLEGGGQLPPKNRDSIIKTSTQNSSSSTTASDDAIVVDDELNKPSSSNSGMDDEVRAPIPQKQAVLVEDEYHALPYPQRRQRSAARNAFDGFRDFKKEAEEHEKLLQQGVQPARNARKRQRLHELFRPPVDIIHVGNFQSARNSCTAKCKWLLVNIQNAMEFPCQILNRDVWSNKVVREVLKENFVLWQVHNDTDEGQHYATFYQIHNYPHLAIIDPRTGERMVVWENLGSNPSANQFAELATMFLAENPPFTNDMNSSTISIEDDDVVDVTKTDDRKNKPDALIDKSEDAQLEAAIKASLEMCNKQPKLVAIDDDEEEGSIVTVDESDESEIEISDDEDGGSVENDEIPSNKKRKINEAPGTLSDKTSVKTTKGCYEKPNVEITEEKPPTTKAATHTQNILDDPTKEKVKILLRTPTNERKQILIYHEATLEDLAREVSKLGWSSSRYELIKSFPRQNLSSLDQTTTLEKAGLHKQETIFIQDR